MSIIHHKSGSTTFNGQDTEIIRALAVAGVLKLHAVGLKCKDLRGKLAYVERLAGQHFSTRRVAEASATLKAWAMAARDAAEHIHE